ncbi:unnamed protein product, partial [marine sediment metagenome]
HNIQRENQRMRRRIKGFELRENLRYHLNKSKESSNVKLKGELKFLFGILHPRELPHFLSSLRDIDYIDVFLAKNMPILKAMKTIKNYFLDHDYDYLILTSDDIEIPYLAPMRIMQTLEIYKLDLLSGWSPITPASKLSNIAGGDMPKEIMTQGVPFSKSQYKFYTVQNIIDFLRKGDYLIPIWFQGWSITGMRKECAKLWDCTHWYFQEDGYFSPKKDIHGTPGFDASADLSFCHQMWTAGYKTFADLTVAVPHYPPGKQALRVGKDPEDTVFIEARI